MHYRQWWRQVETHLSIRTRLGHVKYKLQVTQHIMQGVGDVQMEEINERSHANIKVDLL